jgi:hypothetical protein
MGLFQAVLVTSKVATLREIVSIFLCLLFCFLFFLFYCVFVVFSFSVRVLLSFRLVQGGTKAGLNKCRASGSRWRLALKNCPNQSKMTCIYNFENKRTRAWQILEAELYHRPKFHLRFGAVEGKKE